MAVGSKVVIAEVNIGTEGRVTWRVASGPGWARVGGQRTLAGGLAGTHSRAGGAAGEIADVQQALRSTIPVVEDMALWLDGTEPLPLGSLDHVRGGGTRRYF